MDEIVLARDTPAQIGSLPITLYAGQRLVVGASEADTYVCWRPDGGDEDKPITIARRYLS